MQNIILIGMPGSGKSTVGALLAERLGRPYLEADEELEKAAGMPIPRIFEQEGEEGFRRRETETLAELGKQSGIVLSTGGGCVTREENYPLLHQNGVIVRITRPVALLAREGRPLSLHADLNEMILKRDPLYSRFADLTVQNTGTPEETAKKILEALS
jgi:shikimate dehydrogenase